MDAIIIGAVYGNGNAARGVEEGGSACAPPAVSNQAGLVIGNSNTISLLKID